MGLRVKESVSLEHTRAKEVEEHVLTTVPAQSKECSSLEPQMQAHEALPSKATVSPERRAFAIHPAQVA